MDGGHQRPDTPWGRRSAEPLGLAPIRGDPPTPPLDKGRLALGAGGGYMLLRSGPQYYCREYDRVYHTNSYPPVFLNTPPLY